MLYEGLTINSQQASEAKTVPAPIGGLNNRDGLAAMPEQDAYVMDNILPGTLTCSVRPGNEIHCETGITTGVISLEVFSGVVDTLLAFGDGQIVKASTATPEVIRTGLNSNRTVATMFSTVADSAQFLIITTGLDMPMSYNGTVITDLVFTGTMEAAQNLNFVCGYKGRLFWATNGRLGFYYLPPGQIMGAMEWFDLGQVAHGGGYLQAIATYSEDAGNGPDDYIVFITSNGEYIMYTGDDPGDAAAWSLVGRYRYAAPVGRKCVADYAGDLIVLTVEGAIQFSEIRKLADTRLALTALTSKLGSALSDLNIYRDEWGWCMVLYPMLGWLVVSVPGAYNETGRHWHFVMNTITQAWGRCYSNEWDAQCWAVANDNLYMGRYDGSVRVVAGLNDNNTAIPFSAKQAYNYFGTPTHKHFKWAQFLVKSDQPVALSSQLSVDYRKPAQTAQPTPTGDVIGAIWDVSYWDADYWAQDAYTQVWIAPYGDFGVVGSHWLSGSIFGATFEWYSTEHVFEKAQGLL